MEITEDTNIGSGPGSKASEAGLIAGVVTLPHSVGTIIEA